MTPQPPAGAPARPADVDTGFWLWLVALVLLLIGYVVDAVTVNHVTSVVIALTVVFALTLGAIVLTFLLLMRSGYRWTRTALTGGGVATVIYTTVSLFSVPREPVTAVTFAVTGIVGSVLIVGGVYLLHRPDAHGFFTR